MPAERLIVFVKRPRPGQVKTRLARDLGAEDATELYRAMAEHVLRRTAAALGGYAQLVCFTPADAADEVARWLPAVPRVAQVEGDLGQRMHVAFASAFAEGAARVVLIGTDAPALESERVSEAFAALRHCDVVLGRARDGGYYLIGLAAPRPELFERIPWSTSAVHAETLARAHALRLRTVGLPELGDVDALDDVRREWKSLAPLLQGREALRRRLEAVLTGTEDRG